MMKRKEPKKPKGLVINYSKGGELQNGMEWGGGGDKSSFTPTKGMEQVLAILKGGVETRNCVVVFYS